MITMLDSINSPLRIDTIALPQISGRIGMTLCPGKKYRGYFGTNWNRDIAKDLEAIINWGATAVVTLMESYELEMLEVTALPAMLHEAGLQWYHLPIRDMDIPDSVFEKKWRKICPILKAILSDNRKVLLHCRGGIGRTGTIAARLLVEFGLDPKEAIDHVRRTRKGTIETVHQELYILSLK